MLVSTGCDLTDRVCPPRSRFVNFSMGNPFGPPNQPDYQRQILCTALELASADVVPGEGVDLQDIWPTDFTDKVTKSLLAM